MDATLPFRFLGVLLAVGLVRFAWRDLGWPGRLLAAFAASGLVYVATSL